MKKFKSRKKEWKTLKSTWEINQSMKYGKNKWKKRMNLKQCNNSKEEKFKWNLPVKLQWKLIKKKLVKRKILSKIWNKLLLNWEMKELNLKNKFLKTRKILFKKFNKVSKTLQLKDKKSLKTTKRSEIKKLSKGKEFSKRRENKRG